MSVDTREKRASAVGHFYTALPLPDAAAETAADRRQVSWVYAGTLAAAVVAPSPAHLVSTAGQVTLVSTVAQATLSSVVSQATLVSTVEGDR